VIDFALGFAITVLAVFVLVVAILVALTLALPRVIERLAEGKRRAHLIAVEAEFQASARLAEAAVALRCEPIELRRLLADSPSAPSERRGQLRE
jgi:hypothetical protein